MLQEFPKPKTTFLKASDFQDNEKVLTYKGWERKSNEDRPAMGKLPASTWQQNLKYCLKYTYPELAIDPLTGQQKIGSDGQPLKNSNYLREYPKGYTIVYHFEEGSFESGSYPLYRAFMNVQPRVGEHLVISKTGLKENTKWTVKRIKSLHPNDVPEINVDKELQPDTELPF